MSGHSTGYDYVPDGSSESVLRPGELSFAAAGLAHGHIYAMCFGLESAGARCKLAWDSDSHKLADFLKRFPEARPAKSLEEILSDPEVKLVANAGIPCERFGVGEAVLRSGRDFFVDKPPFTKLEQLEEARKLVAETGKKYMPYYAERVHNQAAETAAEMVKGGAIGRVLQVLILAPHRLSKSARPDWFFEKEKYGGILCDIGSHQFEQFLEFSGCDRARVISARAENFNNPDKPGLEDFGEALVETENGASCYCRVDWFTPDGLPVWGDGRTFILGTKGYLEIRKYIDFARAGNPPQSLWICDSEGVRNIDCRNMKFPFFKNFVLDVLSRGETAMSQSHAFAAAELSLKAQMAADSARLRNLK